MFWSKKDPVIKCYACGREITVLSDRIRRHFMSNNINLSFFKGAKYGLHTFPCYIIYCDDCWRLKH